MFYLEKLINYSKTIIIDFIKGQDMSQQQLAIEWAQKTLTKLGHPVIPPESIRDMPWSKVWRFSR